MEESTLVGAARPDELRQGLALAFRHLPEDERKERVGQALRMVKRRQLDPAGIMVLRGRRRLFGSVVCQVLPGKAGLIWPPQVLDVADRIEGEDLLAQAALAWLTQNGARLFQSMLTRQEAALAEPLLRNGFRHITTLRFLRHFLDPGSLLHPGAARLALERYSQCDRDLFHDILLRSYAGSLDCPELNGRRDLADIIAGHQAQGRHDPDYWWLARQGGQPVGVLLASIVPEYAGFEVAYVGIVPEARRRGFGRELMRAALQEMRAAGASQIALTVDVRNHHALALYAGLGFEAFDHREVLLCFAASTADNCTGVSEGNG
jgi:GNAT superfamily N-acetyltransferase